MSHGAVGAREASVAFALPLVALSTGHMLSNAVRTLPAVAADLLQADLRVDAEGLASLTGAYHFAFAAAQIPVGVALDRFGVRRVSLALLATVCVGAALAALAGGAAGFLIAQVVMGLGCAGMLIAPMTLAARLLDPVRFGLWSGLIQALGNVGMLLSASPLAILVEHAGWRAGFWASVAFGLLAMAAVASTVPRDAPAATPERTLAGDAREVVRLLGSRALRPVLALAFASFAVVIGVRGLWGGPWLMEVKGLGRVEVGNVLLLATLALAVGPALGGLLDRRFAGRRRALLAGGHLLAAGCLLGVAAGAAMPVAYDAALLFAFGLFVSIQPLTFALTRAAVPPGQVGKALAAVNLSFFLGAAALQAASGPVAVAFGVGAAIAFLALSVVACTLAFLALSRPGGAGAEGARPA